jgi:hypothetical protein
MEHFTTKGADPAQAVLALLNEAHAHSLPLDEVVTRLGAALQRNLNYLAYRARRNRRTAYDEALEQESEVIASAIHYLQHPQDEAREWKTRYSELLKIHNEQRALGSE